MEINYVAGVDHPVDLGGVPPEAVRNEAEEEWELGQHEEGK